MRDSAQTRKIQRRWETVDALVHTVLATSVAIDLRGAAGAQLLVPAGPASQTLTVYVFNAATGTFLPLYNAAGEAVTLTAEASRAYDLPEAIFAAGWIKLVAGTTAFTGSFALKG